MTTHVALDGDTGIVITRRLAAPPALVFRAHLEPELIRRWMVGPAGWTMPVCTSDPRTGGAFRFEWRGPAGESFHATGEFIGLTPDTRIEHVERMFLPDPTPDNRVVTELEPDGGHTRLTVRMRLADAAAREVVMESGMIDGLEGAYAALETLADEVA
ncbi:MAG: hypothetical protein RLZZ528_2995 [Pseudomonadota bacterium]